MSKNIYFISDCHFGHANVIKYDKRPFSSIEEMREKMIENWNSVVKPNDDVYELGDFAFADEAEIIKILDRLNGNIHHIYGNHDKQIKKSRAIQAKYVWCRDYFELRHGNETLVLNHYPYARWNKSHRGSIHLHGHEHGAYIPPGNYKIMDVGAPCINYTPIELTEVLQIMSTRESTPHH